MGEDQLVVFTVALTAIADMTNTDVIDAVRPT